MRHNRLLLLLLFLFVVIIIYLRSPGDNKDFLKLNEIAEKINEIEKLIKTNKKIFELIKNAVIERQLNGNAINDLKNSKEMLELLQSQSNMDEGKQVIRWNNILYKICPRVDIAKSDIDMTKLYEKMDFSDKNGGVWKQGFNINYQIEDFKMKKLKVFVIPHSHQDPGWIKTYDEYFKEDSKIILDNMLNFLIKEPNIKFIYAEVTFFRMWWDTLNDDKKAQVKKLLKNKQLEIVTGGWVMTDEANTHYFSILNQLTEGHEWLKANLNYIPQTGWAIDPFGYSQVMPYILKKSGINNMVIQRVHYIVKKNLALKKQLEFRWKQYWDSTNKYAIPCHMMPFYSYDIPHTCGPDPSICCQFDFLRIISFKCPWNKNPVEITDENVKERAEMLLDQYRKKSRLYDNGNVVLIPLGDDFRYRSEKEWMLQYSNYQKLMNYMNNQKDWNVEAKFGVLSDYFDAIKKEKLENLPLLTGDMFSYADREDHYWTGYFTSRPLLKTLDRILMTNLRTAEIILSLSLVYDQKYKRDSLNAINNKLLIKKIDESRKTFALFQHHDAITGTSKSYVALDYGNRLLHSINSSKFVFIQAAQNILQNNVGKNQLNQIIFDVDDILKSYGDPIEKDFIDFISSAERYVYLFNSLSQPRQVLVNIPIKANLLNGIRIVGSGNQIIRCQLTPFLQSEKNINLNKHFVSFKLNIGPLAFEKVRLMISNDLLSENNCLSANINIYNMEDSISLSKNYKVLHQNTILSNFIIMENSLNKIYINSTTGFMESIENYSSKIQNKLSINFKKYGVKHSRETSGAYIFVPDGDGEIIESNKHGIIHIQGQLYEEIVVKTLYLSHYLRLYKVDGLLANAIDIENVVDISKEFNFEISMILQTDFITPSKEFYVDSNCFQFNRRTIFDKLPVQGNVYPMTCGAYLESKTTDNIVHKMSLFSKQSNGVRGGKYDNVESEKLATLEVFLDRILNQDDNRGLFESLIDNKIVSKNYRLLLEGWKQEKYIDSELGELTISGLQLLNDLNYPVHQMYVKSSFTNQIATNFVGQKSLLTGFGLPCDYQMVNFKTANINEFPKLTIHRLKLNCEARYISEGSCKFSRKKSPLIKSMFDDLTIKFVDKLKLTGVENVIQKILPEDINMELMELEAFEVHFDS